MLRHLITRPDSDRDDGFTVTELMAVTAIIGILSAIAIPSVIGQRKSNQDIDTQYTANQIASWLTTEGKARDTTKSRATLADASEYKEYTELSAGTIVSLHKTATGIWCMSAYNDKGKDHNSASTAYQINSSPAACQSEDFIVSETYKVVENSRLTINDPEATASVCGAVQIPENQRTYVSKKNLISEGANGGAPFAIVGYFELNETCTAIDYNFRVKDAVPDMSYISGPIVVQSAGFANQKFALPAIEIVGKETVQGSIPTNLVEGHSYDTITLDGFTQHGFELQWRGGAV